MYAYDKERIEHLRSHALSRKQDNSEWRYLYEKAYLESAQQEKSTPCRVGMAQRYMFANAQPVIDGGELVVGKHSCRALSATEEEEWTLIRRYALPAKPRSDGQAAHMAVDYELLLQKGVSGILEDIQHHMAQLDCANPDQLKKHEFYRSCCYALEGVVLLADSYAQLAAELAQREPDAARKQELERLSAICAKVPRHPAGSFYEAVQSVHFIIFCLSAQEQILYQLGRPDRYLWPYYEKDIRCGALTQKEAQTLIDCLGLLYNEYIPSGLAVGLMVGGRNADGRDTTNDLSYMFVDSVRHVKMIYPGVGLCCHKGMPEDLLRLACDILAEGHSHPALFNDEVITQGLLHYGLSKQEACQYIHSTCVEITPCASSACWVASPYTNLPQLLLDLLGVGEGDTQGKPVVSFESFAQLKQAYFHKLAAHIRHNLIEENRSQLERTAHSFNPLLSCFVNDCLKEGRDIESGGARYNWIMPSFVGVANLADSFAAIEQLVFEEKRFTLQQLCDMLRCNFEGYEKQRLFLKNRVTKYGNDDERADAYVQEITQQIAQSCQGYRTVRGGQLVPSLFCWVMHEQFGTCTMATPDGRKAGFPLGDGSGPAQGNEKKGPTASILSSTKWDHTPFVGGIAVNLRFSKKLFSESSKDKLLALIHTFMERGGFEMQVNVLDQETLQKAQEHPEQYADLVVRVGGYSDYFVRLSPAMQAEVMQRTEHCL
ncbi:MAG TPA: hypothetical protein IAA58_00295 [Candidatus Gallacutalibacter stercoravium]|nr:hypothetical protein [Candidatus Gallacutalibacter stercoravium]